MKKIIITISLFASLLMLCACSGIATDANTQAAKKQEKKERIVVISSADPIKVLPAFTTFTWDEGYNRVLSAANTLQENQVKASIRKQLTTYLQTKGYHYQPASSKADVTIGFLFAMRDTTATKEIAAKFGLPPSHNKNQIVRGYKKDTFFVTVLDNLNTKVYWRSMLQGATGLGNKLQDANNIYMQDILQSMMGGFPKAGR